MSFILEKFDKKEVKDANELIGYVNKNITGRVCVTNYLYILYLLKKMMGEKCRVYAETGTLFGGSLIYLMQDKTECKFIGIDLFDGYYGKPLDPVTKIPVDVKTVLNNIDKLNKHGHNAYLVKGSSYGSKAIEAVKNLTKTIDLFFIDGDHSIRGVIMDFISYKDLITPGGYIVFDNYSSKTWLEVKKAVDIIYFDKFGFIPKGEFGECFIVQKKL